MKPKLLGKRLAGASGAYLIANLLNASIPFLLLPVLTRYLTTTEYGVVAMFQTFVAALSAFTGLSVHGAALRKYYDVSDERELQDYIGSCLQILIFSTFLTLFLVFLTKNYLSALFDLSSGWLFLAVLASSASFIINIRMGQWQVRNAVVKYGVFFVSQGLINVFLSLFLVIILKFGGDGRVIAMAWTPILFAGLAMLSLVRSNLISVSWHLDHIKDALRFGIPLIPHVAGAFLLLTIDRLIVNAKLGLGEAGIYMAAVQLAMVASICFDALNRAFVPWLYERLARNIMEEKLLIVRATYIYFMGLLVVAFGGFLIGPYAVRVLIGDNYQDASQIIGWLLMGQIFKGFYLMVTNYIFFSKKTIYLSMVTMTSGLINVLLLFCLIDYMGLKGAAMAFTIATAIQFLLAWYVANRTFAMPWFSSLIWKQLPCYQK